MHTMKRLFRHLGQVLKGKNETLFEMRMRLWKLVALKEQHQQSQHVLQQSEHHVLQLPPLQGQAGPVLDGYDLQGGPASAFAPKTLFPQQQQQQQQDVEALQKAFEQAQQASSAQPQSDQCQQLQQDQQRATLLMLEQILNQHLNPNPQNLPLFAQQPEQGVPDGFNSKVCV